MSKRETDSSGELTIGIDKLGILNRLGDLGVEYIEDRLEQLVDAELEVKSTFVRGDFVEPNSVALKFGDDRRLGVRVRIDGAPRGCVLVLLPPASANRAVRMMLRDTVEDVSEVSNEMAVSALVELGGMVANGFLDGLADTFDQHIAAAAPVTVNSTTSQAVERVLSREDNHGLYIASALNIAAENIELEVYLFPENETFVKILNLIDVDMVFR